MKQINLLLVGDIHYPELITQRFADYKDKGIATRLFDATAPHPLQIVMRALTGQCKNLGEVHGILFCGDLTSWGKLDAYKECVEYLEKNLELRNRSRWRLDQLHAVPGNHDINRASVDHEADDLLAKFQELDAVWAAADTPILATAALRSTVVSSNDSSVGLFSLNSCLGCGEKRYLPERIRDSLRELLHEVSRASGEEDAFALLGEQLDTPAFANDHVTSLTEAIESSPHNLLPVVLAHHNILSQALLRYDLYTEVINGGMVRTRLSTCNRPVIYCHGHIHEDPIEIIRTPELALGPLVSISAPRFDHGFLRLELSFSSTNEPLGCTVIPHRFTTDGGVKSESNSIRRVPLRGPRDVSRGNPHIRDYLKSAGFDYQQFFTVLENVRRSSGKQTAEKYVAEVMLEAEWYGLAEILNRTELPKFWQVRRLV